jgi:hypothetical protein
VHPVLGLPGLELHPDQAVQGGRRQAQQLEAGAVGLGEDPHQQRLIRVVNRPK